MRSKQKIDKNNYDHRLLYIWSIAVRMRDGNKCQICQSTWRLDSHHIFTKSRATTRYNICNGITLCRDCHRDIAHLKKEYFKEWLIANWFSADEYHELEQKSYELLHSVNWFELKLLYKVKREEWRQYLTES